MYATIEARVHDGVIIPTEASRLPKEGRALVILLPDAGHKARWADRKQGAGWLKLDKDPVEWQRNNRDEWGSRP